MMTPTLISLSLTPGSFLHDPAAPDLAAWSCAAAAEMPPTARPSTAVTATRIRLRDVGRILPPLVGPARLMHTPARNLTQGSESGAAAARDPFHEQWALDLPGRRGPRQLVDDLEAPRLLEPGQRRRGVRAERVEIERVAGIAFGNDGGAHDLAPLRIRNADDGHLAHGGVRGQRALDLGR